MNTWDRWLLPLAGTVLFSLLGGLPAEGRPTQDSPPQPTATTLETEGPVDPLQLLLDPPAAPTDPKTPAADDALLAAATSGDLATVIDRLHAGVPVEGRGIHGRTALMGAVGAGHAGVVRHLLAAGAGLETRDDSGNTALFFAPAAGAEMVALLLHHGARATARNAVGTTPLHAAALLGAEEAVKALLAAGGPVGGSPEGVRDPLEEAVLAEHFAVADLLRAAGGTLDRALEKDGSLLHRAARQGRIAVLEYLLGHGVDPDRPAPDLPLTFPAPLHFAVQGNQWAAVARLLTAGADPNPLDTQGRTPLQVAAAEGRGKVIDALVAGGADLDRAGREEHRNPPLLLATLGGHTATAQQLLRAGAAVDGANRNHVTALMFASYRGDEALVRDLLAAGAAVDASNRDGNTALVFAAARSRGAIVNLLLDHGADANRTTFIDAFGEVTPLLLAAGRGEVETARVLLEHGARIDEPGDVVNHGVVTPLLLAASQGFPAVVALLLDHGADPKTRDDQGHTALERAREGGHGEVVALLEAHQTRMPQGTSAPG
jgi:ankyrin repeat protein